MFKPYIYGAIAILLITSAGGLYLKGRSDGKAVILSNLSDDKIKVLKDGKEIDNEVLSLDDNDLCLALGGC